MPSARAFRGFVENNMIVWHYDVYYKVYVCEEVSTNSVGYLTMKFTFSSGETRVSTDVKSFIMLVSPLLERHV